MRQAQSPHRAPVKSPSSLLQQLALEGQLALGRHPLCRPSERAKRHFCRAHRSERLPPEDRPHPSLSILLTLLLPLPQQQVRRRPRQTHRSARSSPLQSDQAPVAIATLEQARQLRAALHQLLQQLDRAPSPHQRRLRTRRLPPHQHQQERAATTRYLLFRRSRRTLKRRR